MRAVFFEHARLLDDDCTLDTARDAWILNVYGVEADVFVDIMTIFSSMNFALYIKFMLQYKWVWLRQCLFFKSDKNQEQYEWGEELKSYNIKIRGDCVSMIMAGSLFYFGLSVICFSFSGIGATYGVLGGVVFVVVFEIWAVSWYTKSRWVKSGFLEKETVKEGCCRTARQIKEDANRMQIEFREY